MIEMKICSIAAITCVAAILWIKMFANPYPYPEATDTEAVVASITITSFVVAVIAGIISIWKM